MTFNTIFAAVAASTLLIATGAQAQTVSVTGACVLRPAVEDVLHNSPVAGRAEVDPRESRDPRRTESPERAARPPLRRDQGGDRVCHRPQDAQGRYVALGKLRQCFARAQQ